jgi:hypothetical protein
MQNYSFICSKRCIRRYETKPDYSGLNSSSKNVRDCNTCIRHYEKGDLGTDLHSILAGWRNHCYLQLSVHGVNYVRQAEIETAEPLVPEPSACEFEMAIEKLK